MESTQYGRVSGWDQSILQQELARTLCRARYDQEPGPRNNPSGVTECSRHIEANPLQLCVSRFCHLQDWYIFSIGKHTHTYNTYRHRQTLYTRITA